LMDSSLLPSFFMFISTSLTLRVIFKSRRRSQNYQDHQQSRTKSKDVKFAISSISLNVFFFILNMPLTSFFLIRNFVEIHFELNGLIRSICFNLFFINYANIFFISYIFNSMFRKEFTVLIRELKSKYL
jgi:Na+/H+ antiporter NhaD/arsenite permease-like protein